MRGEEEGDTDEDEVITKVPRLPDDVTVPEVTAEAAERIGSKGRDGEGSLTDESSLTTSLSAW